MFVQPEQLHKTAPIQGSERAELEGRAARGGGGEVSRAEPGGYDAFSQPKNFAKGMDLDGAGGWFGGGPEAAHTENIASTGIKPLLAIDTETGGLEPGRDALLSIAAVLEDGSWCHLRILPPRQWWRLGRRQTVNAGAVKVNGFSEKKWRAAGAVELDVARWQFGLWLSAQCDRLAVTGFQPLAHNAGFDRAFVEAFLAPQKKGGRRGPLDRRWDCSCSALSFARHAGLVACKDASLDSLCAVSGTEREQPHDALSDARACLHGFRWLIRQAAASPILTSTFP